MLSNTPYACRTTAMALSRGSKSGFFDFGRWVRVMTSFRLKVGAPDSRRLEITALSSSNPISGGGSESDPRTAVQASSDVFC